MEQHAKRAQRPIGARSCIRARVSLVFLSTAVPNGTVFEFSEWTDSAAHDLKGDALHALRGAEGMLLAGAAQYARR